MAAPPYSPPSAKPWTMRKTMRDSGAATPITPASGSAPMATVAVPMAIMVIRKATLRPFRSPKAPKASAPSGRTKKPRAKVASARMKPVAGFTPA